MAIRQHFTDILLCLIAERWPVQVEVYCGMALGFDQDAACSCIRAEVPFVACVPFEDQELRWPAQSQEEYRAILSQAKRVEMLGPKPQSTYEATKLLHVRNKHMMDAADIVIACWDGSSGGTSNAVTYASTQRKRIVH